MKNALCVVVSVSLSLLALSSSADVEVEWRASETPAYLADGALAFTYEGGAVKTLTVTPGGEALVVSGDAMAFAPDAELRMAAGGRLAFANDLAGTGKLKILNTAADATIEYSGSLLYTNMWTTMFVGRSLDDYRPVKSVRRGGSGVYDAGVYCPYNVKRAEVGGQSQMSIQLMTAQGANGSAYNTRALLVRLRQNGADIEGILDRACYLEGRVALGEDFEKMVERNAVSPEAGLNPDVEAHTPVYERGYGVSHLLMAKTAGPSVEFRGTVPASLGLELTDDAVCVNGVNVCSSVSGSGALTVAAGESASEDPCVDSYDGFIADSQVLVSSNRLLTELTNVTATITGSYMSGNHYPALFCCFAGTSLCKTGELQVATDIYTWRYVRLEFRQDGLNIKAKALEAGYVMTNPKSDISGYVGKFSVFDPQFDGIRHPLTPIAKSDTGGPTGAFGYKLYYAFPGAQVWNPPATFRNLSEPAEVLNANQFGYTTPKIRIEGSSTARMQTTFSTGYTVPTNCTVEVGANGDLIYDITDATSKPAPFSLIYVEKGGRLRIRRSDSLNYRHHVILDGGWLSFRDDGIYADTWTLLNLLTLRNGALVTGQPIRFGSAGTAKWRVTGSEPSICEASIILVNLGNGEEINVTDVTDDDGVDFVLKGDITSYSGNSSVLHKTGAGTLAHYGACNSGSRISVDGGTWLLTGSATASQDYVLAGGTLGTADGAAVSVGRLVVGGTGKIKVGGCSTLAFADSSSVPWTGFGRVDIDADLEHGAVRFGTSASALTAAQLARLRVNGHHVLLDEDGYARENVTGMTIVVR